MGVAYNPAIVTSGLVLCLDAGNTKSYDKYENLLSNTSTAAAWVAASATNETTYPILGLNTVRVTDLSTDGDSPHLNGTSISVGTYTVSHYIDTVNSTSTSCTFYIFTFHTDSGGFAYSNANATFTLSTKTLSSVSYSGPAWSNATATATNVGGGIYRVSITATTSLNGTGIRAYITPSPIDSSYVIIAGSQYERGSSATDYYQTTGTAKTRGTTWTDLSGRGNNSTMFGSVPFETDVTPCFNFATATGANAANSSLGFTFASNMIQTTGDFTFSCWIKNPNTTTGQTGLFSNSGGGDGYRFGVGLNGIYWLIGPTYQEGVVGFSSGLSASLWYNVVAVFSRSTSQILLYLNGVYQGAATTAASQTAFNGAQVPGLVRSACCGIYTGKLASFVAHNKNLTAAEIQQNFNAMRGRFGI